MSMREGPIRRLSGPMAGSLAVMALLAGCGAAQEPKAAPPPALPSYVVPTIDAAKATTLEQRCGAKVAGALRTLAAPGGGHLEAAELGDGRTWAVLLHQTDEIAMCGWAQYAGWLADQGVHVLLVDLCGWGLSECRPAFKGDQVAQARLAVRFARARADRVTLVGASMGGAVALAAAQRVGADAVVDLSGPASWEGVATVERAAGRTRIPMLIAAAMNDSGIEPERLRAAEGSSPSRIKRFVAAKSGHGWDLVADLPGTHVSDLGLEVRDWIRGPR